MGYDAYGSRADCHLLLKEIATVSGAAAPVENIGRAAALFIYGQMIRLNSREEGQIKIKDGSRFTALMAAKIVAAGPGSAHNGCGTDRSPVDIFIKLQ